MDQTDVLKALASTNPDSYFPSSRHGPLPRYSFLHCALRGLKIRIMAAPPSEKERYLGRVHRRMKKMEALRAFIRERGRSIAAMTALDLGARHGREALLWRGMQGGPIYALDIKPCAASPELRKETRRWIEAVCEYGCLPFDASWKIEDIFSERGIEWITADAAHVPLPDESLDLVFSFSSLEHFADIEGVLAEIWRLLKPGGFFYAEWSHFYSLVGSHSPGFIDIPWGHVFLTSEEHRTLSLELNDVSDAEFRSTVGGLCRWNLAQWRDAFGRLKWKELMWNRLCEPKAEDLLPSWAIDLLPPEITAEDLITDDIEALFQKP